MDERVEFVIPAPKVSKPVFVESGGFRVAPGDNPAIWLRRRLEIFFDAAAVVFFEGTKHDDATLAKMEHDVHNWYLMDLNYMENLSDPAHISAFAIFLTGRMRGSIHPESRFVGGGSSTFFQRIATEFQLKFNIEKKPKAHPFNSADINWSGPIIDDVYKRKNFQLVWFNNLQMGTPDQQVEAYQMMNLAKRHVHVLGPKTWLDQFGAGIDPSFVDNRPKKTRDRDEPLGFMNNVPRMKFMRVMRNLASESRFRHATPFFSKPRTMAEYIAHLSEKNINYNKMLGYLIFSDDGKVMRTPEVRTQSRLTGAYINLKNVFTRMGLEEFDPKVWLSCMYGMWEFANIEAKEFEGWSRNSAVPVMWTSLPINRATLLKKIQSRDQGMPSLSPVRRSPSRSESVVGKRPRPPPGHFKEPSTSRSESESSRMPSSQSVPRKGPRLSLSRSKSPSPPPPSIDVPPPKPFVADSHVDPPSSDDEKRPPGLRRPVIPVPISTPRR